MATFATRLSHWSRLFAPWIALASCGPSTRIDRDVMGDSAVCNGVRTCSADLQHVLCAGAPFESCDAGYGCGSNATCVPACQSAAEHVSSVGCEYYAVAPDVIDEARNACFAVVVVNAWNTPVVIAVDRDGADLPVEQLARIPQGHGNAIQYLPLVDGLLPPDEVAIVSLAGYGCPAGSGIVNASVFGTGRGKAFRIRASAPVVAYDIYPYAGGTLAASSATLLLPTNVLATNYVAVDAYRRSELGVGEKPKPFVAILGTQDGTVMTIRPVAAIEGGVGVNSAPVGMPAQYSLARGEFLQLTQGSELAGSIITSTHPIGLWAGATCLNVDVGDGACDTAHQQIPPIQTLGHRYAAVRYRERFAGQDESVPWRLIGAADNTQLVYSPSKPSGAPDNLSSGQVAEFWAPGPFTISSQGADNPFYAAAYMTGCQRVTPPELFATDCRGDPEFVNVIPIDQYRDRYTFFTDPTFPETNLVFVRKMQDGMFADVMLDCLGVVTGWMPVGSSNELEYARVDLVTGNFSGVGACDNGRRVATSASPFGLTVWGWGNGSTPNRTTTNSYAYPAGGGLGAINSVVLE